MNSIHEPASRTMSKNLTQEKYRVEPGQKQAEHTKCTALASPRAQAAPRPPSQPCPARSTRAHGYCRSPAARALACFARAPAPRVPAYRAPVPPACRAPACRVPLLRACPAPRLRLPNAQPHTQRLSPAQCRDTAACLATQAALSPTTILQVVLRYNLASCSPSSHNTMQCIAIHCSLLPAFSIAIHYTMLQYTFQPNYSPCHNTIFVLQYNSTTI